MARVTVEDCIDKVDSPYELVLVAKERATQLNCGGYFMSWRGASYIPFLSLSLKHFCSTWSI